MRKILICLAIFVCLSNTVWADAVKPAVAEDIYSRMINIISIAQDSVTGEQHVFYSNGIKISSDYIFTTAHSVKDRNRIFIKSDSLIEVEKEMIKFFEGHDFAVINVLGLGLPKIKPIHYGSAEKLHCGQIVICGSRLFYDAQTTFNFLMEGKVCFIDKDFFLVDMKNPQGFSGSGVYNQKGHLIGMVVGSLAFGGEEFTFIYRIDALRHFILEKAVE